MTDNTNSIPHPGEFIRDELDARGWAQRDLAFVLGVSEQAVNMIASGRRGISADMAKALGEAFDVPAEFFVNLQRMYELAQARTPDPSIARKGRIQSAYPLREMINRGWLMNVPGDALEELLAKFFDSAVGEIPHIAYAAKRTATWYDNTPPAQLAWLFRVKQIAREMVVGKYSESSLRESLPRLRALMTAPEETRHVPRILAESGVRYVIVEGLPSGKIDGVCFWLNGASPVIGMSLRYDRIDNFWFVLWHEIEHVLRGHGRQAEILDVELDTDRGGGTGTPEEERIANAAASEACVPQSAMASFIARKQPYIAERDMVAFAARHGIHAGLVAGQIRRRTGRWELFSKHLVKVRPFVCSAAVFDGWGTVAPVSL